jgi:hypothetical protein
LDFQEEDKEEKTQLMKKLYKDDLKKLETIQKTDQQANSTIT